MRILIKSLEYGKVKMIISKLGNYAIETRQWLETDLHEVDVDESKKAAFGKVIIISRCWWKEIKVLKTTKNLIKKSIITHKKKIYHDYIALFYRIKTIS